MASVAGGAVRMTHGSGLTMLAPQAPADVPTMLQECIATRTPWQVCGAQTWTRSGPPIDAGVTLSLQSLAGIVEYVPGDLTITALAGTSLAELQHVTAAHGQWLGLDPAGRREGTIGATIATASSGPLAHAFGTPRDQVLGLEAVTGYGDVVRPGGRVVKNVAGFDLVRLYTGAWGTLGPITTVTLRLRALPVHDVTLVMPVADPDALRRVLPMLRDATVSLLAAEWLDGTTAQAVGVTSGDDAILLRLGGNDRFVRGQRAVLDRLAPNAPCDPDVWGALATHDETADAVVRFSGPVSELAERVARVRGALAATGSTATLQASLGRGTIRAVIHHTTAAAQAVLQSAGPHEQRLVERLPVAWWAAEPDPFGGGLAGRIRDAFDPHHLCNRRRVSHA